MSGDGSGPVLSKHCPDVPPMVLKVAVLPWHSKFQWGLPNLIPRKTTPRRFDFFVCFISINIYKVENDVLRYSRLESWFGG